VSADRSDVVTSAILFGRKWEAKIDANVDQ